MRIMYTSQLPVSTFNACYKIYSCEQPTQQVIYTINMPDEVRNNTEEHIYIEVRCEIAFVATFPYNSYLQHVYYFVSNLTHKKYHFLPILLYCILHYL